MSMSSHSSSQSDLDREVTEVVSVTRKGHVVYHWAMIQLAMTPDMERFMQDIVSVFVYMCVLFPRLFLSHCYLTPSFVFRSKELT